MRKALVLQALPVSVSYVLARLPGCVVTAGCRRGDRQPVKPIWFLGWRGLCGILDGCRDAGASEVLHESWRVPSTAAGGLLTPAGLALSAMARMPAKSLALLGATVIGFGVAVASASAAPPAPLAIAPEVTRWAHVMEGTGVRAAPRGDSKVVSRLRTATYLGRPEVVLVTGRSADGLWTRVRYPQQGVRQGWVPSATLGRVRAVTTQLIVDRQRQRLSLYRKGRRVLHVNVGVGASESPTPRGHFYVREKLAVRPVQPIYGPRAIGLSAHSRHRTFWPGGGQVGIHGTNQPELIPGRPSNGCVRLRNADSRRLYEAVPIGTPVTVR